MGTSYQSILALGELATVRAAVADAGREAYVTAVGPERWAVVPREEDEIGYAEVDSLAELISVATGEPAATFEVFDSDVMSATVYVAGEPAHQYVSDRSWVTQYWDDDDNEFWAGFDGTLHPVDGPLPPPGPSGADPAAFAALGVGEVDPHRLGAALRGEVPLDDAPRLFAECQHAEILAALGVDPCPLTRPFRAAHLDHAPLHVRP
ncbi:hypothetical protein [Micromonospora okii]|uniref:hypothetical protein n=1 Tax=Micromonospora okii TaxID=1182970 RepID=UPI001E4C6A54|nr:hypothetical protein [Micromonospora okii]